MKIFSTNCDGACQSADKHHHAILAKAGLRQLSFLRLENVYYRPDACTTALTIRPNARSDSIHRNLLGYAGVTQFFPGAVVGIFWRRATMRAVFAGLLCGEATLAFLILTNRDPFCGWSAGFIALCLNCLATVSLSLVAAPGRSTAEIPVA